MPRPIDFAVPTGFWIYRAKAYGLEEDLTLALCVPDDVDHRGLRRSAAAEPSTDDFLNGPGLLHLQVEALGESYDSLRLVGRSEWPKAPVRRFRQEIRIPFREAGLVGRTEFALDERIANRPRQWVRFATSVFIQAMETPEMGEADRLGLRFWSVAPWERELLGS